VAGEVSRRSSREGSGRLADVFGVLAGERIPGVFIHRGEGFGLALEHRGQIVAQRQRRAHPLSLKLYTRKDLYRDALMLPSADRPLTDTRFLVIWPR